MMAAQARAFGGPLDGQWFPVGQAAVYYHVDDELAELVSPAEVGVAAPMPEPRHYRLAAVGYRDPGSIGIDLELAYVETIDDELALIAGVRVVTRLALLARGNR